MKRYVVLISIVMAVLIVAFNAFGQEEDATSQKVQQRLQEAQNMRERLQNMSPEEREKLRAQMEERRKKYQNMSDEERAKLREQMLERAGSRPRAMGRDAQLKSILIQLQSRKRETTIRRI